MQIGLTYDLRETYLKAGFSEEETAEFDSPVTIEALETALGLLGHQTERIGNIQELVPRLAAGQRWELVFNIAEGLRGFGREAQIPALLDAYGIPCVFSDAMVLSLALHKGMTKRIIRDAGILTPEFALVASPEEIARVTLPFPLFVKPVAEGTSKGITGCSRVETREELHRSCVALLARFAQPVLVESYLPGREFTVGMLGSGADARVLGVMEVGLKAGAESGLYSFHNKEFYETLVDYRLADPEAARKVGRVALASWRVLECRDGGRVDIRMDGQGVPYFLEVNPLAGLHPVRSDLVILTHLLGLDYQTLIGEILASALKRLDVPATPPMLETALEREKNHAAV